MVIETAMVSITNLFFYVPLRNMKKGEAIDMIRLDITLNRLLNGDARISQNEKDYMNLITDNIIRKKCIDNCEVQDVRTIIKISNILYNNGANALLPVDDEKYDALLILCRKQQIPYPVGAPPVQLRNLEEVQRLETPDTGRKVVMQKIPNKRKMIYFNQLVSNLTPKRKEDYEVYINNDTYLIPRKTRNSTHQYGMCGTLDKCKYVLSSDAKAAGAYLNDPTVQIFERDFLVKYMQMGILDPRHIELIASIKYDGISVEGTVQGDTLIQACTRGDTSNNEASDLTPALSGMKFYRATGKVDDTEVFGIKFEMIISYDNLRNISIDAGKKYVNARNAVIGILGGLDARKFREYLTPIPLETSLDLPRMDELEFLNRYYTRGIDMRYVAIQGSYSEVLYGVKAFVDNANMMRGYMPFQYDGVVVEIMDKGIKKRLGKRGSIPLYAIAIKFPPLKRESIFTHYTFTVGQTGAITPMAHFEPVEFIGAIHDKTTVHSYKRFKELRLASGDKINLTLNNDVIVYLTKPEQISKNPPEEFPSVCPSCGNSLMQSDSGDTVYCVNPNCPERTVARLSNLLAKLNVKDVSTETIRALGIKSLKELLEYPYERVKEILGPVQTDNFMNRIQGLENAQYYDYRIMGAIGFVGIGAEKWKLILSHMKWEDIIHGDDNMIRSLIVIKGIGPSIVENIIEWRPFFKEDMIIAYEKLNHVSSYGSNKKIEIRFTGIRDKELEDMFNHHTSGDFNANDGAVTKETHFLIVPFLRFESSKTKRAFKILNDRARSMGLNIPTITWSNISLAENMYPKLITPDDARRWLEQYKK